LGMIALVIAGIGIVGLFLFYVVDEFRSRPATQPAQSFHKPQKYVQGRSHSRPVANQPKVFYHGTTVENAWQILKTGEWLVGKARPYGIYLTDDFEVAKGYSFDDGLIVLVEVDSSIELVNRSGGIWLYPKPSVKPNITKGRIEGLWPFAIMDPERNWVEKGGYYV